MASLCSLGFVLNCTLVLFNTLLEISVILNTNHIVLGIPIDLESFFSYRVVKNFKRKHRLTPSEDAMIPVCLKSPNAAY